MWKGKKQPSGQRSMGFSRLGLKFGVMSPSDACRYGKQALSAMYRTIVGRRDAGESGVTPEFMAEALAERELSTGTPEWNAARLAAFKVRVEYAAVSSGRPAGCSTLCSMYC